MPEQATLKSLNPQIKLLFCHLENMLDSDLYDHHRGEAYPHRYQALFLLYDNDSDLHLLGKSNNKQLQLLVSILTPDSRDGDTRWTAGLASPQSTACWHQTIAVTGNG